MKWIAISGSWRKTNQNVESDVRQKVKTILSSGNGIVTGGALNVDFFATDEAMKADVKGEKIKVFLPVSLDRYAAHYRKRAKEGVITENQAEILINLLTDLKQRNAGSVIEEPKNIVVDNTTYFERNTKIIEYADALVAFQVNKSPGVEDTIQKAKTKGIPISLFSYTID